LRHNQETRFERWVYVKALPQSILVLVLVIATALPATARKTSRTHAKATPSPTPNAEQTEAATRLQIFLDRANFSPGALTGTYNDFTIRALELYRQSRGEEATPSPSPSASSSPSNKSHTPPDTTGLDLSSIDPTFITYTVTDIDLQSIGPLPTSVVAQAKLTFLPYRDAAEAIAEKFHCALHFLEQLNPGRTKTIKVGDQLKVPNVEPFELTAVKDLKPGSEMESLAANDQPDDTNDPDNQSTPGSKDESGAPGQSVISVKVDTKTNILSILDGDKVMAAYPVTIGSNQTASPIGEWKVRGISKLPRFRYDKEMLQHGRRSGNFHVLPPGPNSPVGVIWIALNKKGIGLHGTNEPDNIGHSVSHGCIRLTNWDVTRLAQKVKAGVPVSIR
jgi:lipoprotein-anchoring transpeptidase ErfK/SrfK